MIQKKKFSDALTANKEVLGGVIGLATKDKNGLMSALLAEYNERRFIPTEDGKFTRIIQRGSALSSFFMIIGDSNYNTPETSLLLVRSNSNVGFYRISGRIELFQDSSNDIYIKGINYSKLYLILFTKYSSTSKIFTPMDVLEIDESELTEIVSSNI